ncbi:MAG: response regulator, partial [Pseudomonadota bacterium]
ELLARLISRRGFRALTAHSGEEALEMVRKSRPHCLVVDLRLPMMTGIDFIKAVNIATGGRPPPTLAITAMTLSDEEVGALEPTVSSLHYKGALTPAILLTEINRVLSKPASPLPNPPANETGQTSGMAAAE